MRELRIRFAAFSVMACAALVGCRSEPAEPAPLSSWVELAPGGMVAVRAVTEALACPEIEIDGKVSRMAERAAPDAAFPVHACATLVPRSTASVRLAGRDLPLPHRAVNRIVVFGDTGCRLKGVDIQLCNDPRAWPFALVAAQVAARHPDLVIHVGDYHYRETPCPAGIAGCAGTPAGDNWAVWNADFFQPAAPLLADAPWVMVRGNHETCGRGGKGWFRFLDPSDGVLDCPTFVDPYAIELDGLNFLVTDSASADDAKAAPEFVRRYADAFAKAAAQIHGPFWMLTHRPVWAVAPVTLPGSTKTVLAPLNRTEQAAIDSAIPSNLDMVVSGHVHTFATYDFGGARPAQLVAGVGGSLYDKMELAPGSPIEIDGMAASAFATTEYGYLVMDRTQAGWDGTLYGADGDKVLAHCNFRSRSVDCR